jgi:hypothetical protein
VTRRERIVFLLEHLNDVCGPGSSLGGSGGTGEGPGFVLTSAMAEHPSVVELGRCLAMLDRMAPRHGDAVRAWFCCHWYVERVPKTVRKGGRLVRLVNADGSQAVELRRVRGLPAWMTGQPVEASGEPRMVARGVDFIAGVFRGEPYVPEQLRQAA